MRSSFSASLVAFAVALPMFSCAASTADEAPSGQVEQHWDSDDGNPSHPTHSFMAEWAINDLRAELPELKEFEKAIVTGANLEIHDLPHKTEEALRLEVGGNNWTADRPEILWDKARASYAAGDRAGAYRYVGILLHYVQDMGSPAHAFHVIHQSSPRNWDHIEVLGFFDFHADFKAPTDQANPNLDNPVLYIEWSAAKTREHWNGTFPGTTYERRIFPSAYADMTDTHWAFLRKREADTTRATAYALRAAALGLRR